MKRVVITLIGVMMASSAMAITVKRPDASIEIYSRSPSQGITVSQNGNVGIGTKNSSAQLAVSGDAVFTGTVNALVFAGSGAGLTNLLANTANYVVWGNVGSKPTTVAGYGITDIATQVVNTSNYALTANKLVSNLVSQFTNDAGYLTSSGGIDNASTANYARTASTANYVVWGNVGSKPTTVAGYGITDIATQVVNTSSIALTANYVVWGNVGSKPTTVAGYGITDIATQVVNTSSIALTANYAANSALLGSKAEAALNVSTALTSTTANIALTANVALSLVSSTVTKTSNYTMTGVEAYIVANPAVGAITITLPDPAVVSGKSFTIKKVDSNGYDVVISAGANTIDGNGIYVLTAKGEFVTLLSTGATDWVIAGNN